MKSTYLLVDFFTIIVPLLFSFHPKLKFYENFRSLLLSMSVAALPFIIWDIQFTRMGVWGFNENYITGVYFYNLPIEEVLFFFCIPFACVFTYHCLNLFFRMHWTTKTETLFVNITAGLLFFSGCVCYSKIYTALTAISLAILLLYLKYIAKINWLAKLVFIYPALLLPFFIVNGVLTGSGIEQPVVWYNNAENTGCRIFTIPVEDVFYGFELILLNVYFYEYSYKKFRLNRQELE